jgi:hypothetical protein
MKAEEQDSNNLAREYGFEFFALKSVADLLREEIARNPKTDFFFLGFRYRASSIDYK